jgi:hypothetical protein
MREILVEEPHFPTSEFPIMTPPEMSVDETLTSVTFRERIASSKIGQSVLGSLAALGLVTGVGAVEASAAHADTGLVYTVVNPDNDGTQSIYDRNSPNMSDTSRSYPDFSYYGDQLELICGTDGESVGPNNNHRWHLARNISRPEAGETYIPDRYLNTPNKADEKTPGEPECNNEDPNLGTNTANPQKADTAPLFVNYARGKAKDWALTHATDTPPDAGSCTLFVSEALVEGGMPENNIWNTDLVGLQKDLHWRHGSDSAKLTPNFVAYMNSQSYVEVIPLGQLKNGINNVPEAEVGDVIVYDWDNNASPDHADIITGFAANNPDYPLVSGWSEHGSEAVDYRSRGWTWSEEHSMWLQAEPHNHDMNATLIHIRTEDDL